MDKVVTSSPTADTPGLPLGNLDHSNWLATPSLPPRVSELEATQYYWGLYSKPRLIARTGESWDPPSGPGAYPQRIKELRSLGKHELFDVWEDNLALKVHNILNQHQVNWSSTRSSELPTMMTLVETLSYGLAFTLLPLASPTMSESRLLSSASTFYSAMASRMLMSSWANPTSTFNPPVPRSLSPPTSSTPRQSYASPSPPPSV